jgi:glyoxylase-like metal-dependent hydrolase (beta-lactamase superfamily II)
MLRTALLFAFSGLLLLLGACDRKGAAIDKDYPLKKITERVYVVHGPNELPNQANQGFMNNPGFVLTRKGVVVIDPGSSLQTGEMLLKKIASVTADPVIAVFNTHIHGDHWLGNDAIRRAYPRAVIYAHPKMIARSAEAGPFWIDLLNRLTDNAVRGTRPVAPDVGIEDQEVLSLDGMHFAARHTGTAHTDGDLMVEVVEEKVVFLGDNVIGHSVRRMDDGSFSGNVRACDVALKTGAEHFVPGHGDSGGRPMVRAYRGFLSDLYESVRKYQAQGLGDFEMKDKVVADLKAYRSWPRFDAEIGKLISLAYLEAEREAF